MSTKVELLGMIFENPILPASGPIVEGLENLLSLNALPLGGLVTKTISVTAAEVTKPCIVGTKHMIYNSELWSEMDIDYWVGILPELVQKKTKPLGISVGYTCDDFKVTVPRLSPFADFFEVSTHYNRAALPELVKCITSLTDKPVFIKMSPHIEDEIWFVDTILKNGATGVVAFNSFGPGAVVDLAKRSVLIGNQDGNSWVSGPAIKPFDIRRIANIRAHFPDMPIIGCGGVETAEDALEMILAGADLVQMLSSALLKGRKQYAVVVDRLPKVMAENDIESVESLRKTTLMLKPSGKGDYPVIDPVKCTNCGICVRVCPFEAYEASTKPIFSKEKCIRCGLCESLCPVGAISGALR